MVKCTAMFPNVRNVALLPKAGDTPAGWITRLIPMVNVLTAVFVSIATPRRCIPTKMAICTAIIHTATDVGRQLKDGAILIGKTIHSLAIPVQNVTTPKHVLTQAQPRNIPMFRMQSTM